MKPRGIDDLSSMDFLRVPFWIHIHNIPVACLKNECASFRGKVILEEKGDLIGVEVKGLEMRVRV